MMQCALDGSHKPIADQHIKGQPLTFPMKIQGPKLDGELNGHILVGICSVCSALIVFPKDSPR